jgi:aryl-alcohol dehydrogenase-like predicted oxidoreductase
VQKIGVSIYAPSELDMLVPQYQFDIVQAPFNLIDRRIFLSGWLQRLKQDGVEIHTRSAFLQGLLLMLRSEIPSKFATWSELWDIWHNWLAQNSVTAIQASLGYPLSFSEIDRVIVGADSVSQLEEIFSAVAGLTPVDFPDLHCDEESLINPSKWAVL